jgi:exodeoxyribonuclease VII small subunit
VADQRRGKEATFEELYAQLEERARKLEQGNLALEESLKLYEEGAAVAEKLRAILDTAELRVRTLQRRFDDGRAELREPEADYELDE